MKCFMALVYNFSFIDKALIGQTKTTMNNYNIRAQSKAHSHYITIMAAINNVTSPRELVFFNLLLIKIKYAH